MLNFFAALFLSLICQTTLATTQSQIVASNLQAQTSEYNFLVNTSPLITPIDFYQLHQDQIDKIPDGTGLQVLFYSNHHYYLLAGPRSKRLLTVNGGKIESNDQPFTKQLMEEFDEETFGVFTLVPTAEGLALNYHHRLYPVYLYPNASHVAGQPGKFVYLTFTAVVHGFDQNRLSEIAAELSPTALYWSKLGNFLSQQVRLAPQDGSFEAYWLSQRPALDQLLNELSSQYDELKQKNQLIISPEQAFETASMEEAWDKIRQFKSYADLKYCFQNTVGRYSERAGYFVLEANNVLAAANDPNQPITDINGNQVADSLFNNSTVRMTFPLVLTDEK